MKYLAVILLALGVGYAGAVISEGDHQERHIQQVEARYGN